MGQSEGQCYITCARAVGSFGEAIIIKVSLVEKRPLKSAEVWSFEGRQYSSRSSAENAVWVTQNQLSIS